MRDLSNDNYNNDPQDKEMKFLSLWRIVLKRLTHEQLSTNKVAELMHCLYEAFNETIDVCATNDRKVYHELYKILLKEAQSCQKCLNAVNDSGLGNSITMDSRLDSPITTHNGIRRRPKRISRKGMHFSLVKGTSVNVAPTTPINHELNTLESDTSKSSWFNVGIKLVLYIISVVLVISFFTSNLLPLPKFVVTISYTKVPPI